MKRINREIFGYVVQICMILVFVVVSYFIFTGSRLANFASIAAAYDTEKRDLMVSYDKDTDAILSSENTLDKGVLNVKNPNRDSVSSTIYLLISTDANLDTVEFIIDGNTVDTTNATVEDNYYVISVLDYEIGAYQDKAIETEVVGNPFYTTSFSYRFDVESF